MYIYLIRHGQTEANINKIYQGNADVPLNETGKEQAKVVAWRLKEYPLEALYSSHLERALNTARAIGEYHDLKLEIRRELQEISLGEWQGKSREEVEKEYGDFIKARKEKNDFYYTAVPGGESYAELEKRSMAVLEDIVQKTDKDHVALVTHGGVIKSLVGSILGIPHDKRRLIDVYNASITLIRYSPEKDRYKIVTMNDTAHLQ
ncbi:MAG: histidine phosphatase family protein [Candidatus Izemoplasmataceae bacterium]